MSNKNEEEQPVVCVTADVWGDRPLLQLLVHDEGDEPALHIRLSSDRRRVEEVMIREDVQVVGDYLMLHPLQRSTRWENERLAVIPPGPEPDMTDFVPPPDSMWLVRIFDHYDVGRISASGHFLMLPGYEKVDPAKVQNWVMEINAPKS